MVRGILMMRAFKCSLLILIIGSLVSCSKNLIAVHKERNKAMAIYTNAQIYTLDKNNPTAESIVTKADRIVFVGSASQALKYKNEGTRVIDLKGATVIPGLVDAHAHMFSLGKSLMTLNLVDTKSWDEIVELVRKSAAKTHRMNWIVGRGWDQNDWKVRQFPNNKELSRLTPNHPVFLTRIDGHAAIANERALKIAGITKDTNDPEGGQIIRDDEGNPTGVLVDNAIELVSKKMPEYSKEQTKQAILKAQESCLEHGLTQVHDAGIDEKAWEALKELSLEGKLKLRIYAMMLPDTPLYKEMIEKGPIKGLNNGRLSLRTIKMFADGALGSRGALLKEDYSDKPEHRGLLLTPVDRMKKITTEGLSSGFQIATHAIGDGANSIVIDIYEKALKETGAGNARLRIEHVQVIDPKDIERMKRNGIIASMQPTHCTSDMPWAPQRLGDMRTKWAYAWKSIINEGVKFASGSDFPVESNDPLLGIYAAVTREDTRGKPEGGYTPEQKLNIYEAVDSFTKGAAYASFEENIKGELKEGYKADFTVLSKDIFKINPAEILKTDILMTVIDGEIVFTGEK